MNEAKVDEIGVWSETKLDILREYASAYTRVLSNQKYIRKFIYIDAFAGTGYHISKATKEFVLGSPLNALNVTPSFHEFHFIDLDGKKTDGLKRLTGEDSRVHIYNGDCNEILRTQILPRCRYEDFTRALCLIDPYSVCVDWEILVEAANMRSVEIFYNFMIMDANMNVFKHDSSRVSETQKLRMDRAWGDRSWEDIAYSREQLTLFGGTEESKVSNRKIAEEFRQRLQEVAGFGFVPTPIPMKNDQGATIYYLYFASHNKTGGKIVNDIFKKYNR